MSAYHATSGRQRTGRGLLYLGLTIVLVLSVLPMIWALSGSFKNIAEIFALPPHLTPDQPTIANYTTLFTKIQLPEWLWTSLWVAVVSTPSPSSSPLWAATRSPSSASAAVRCSST